MDWSGFSYRTRERWLDPGRILYCAMLGTSIGLCFWVLAALLTVLGGARMLGEYGISLWDLLAIQSLGGLAGGVLVGLIYPLRRSLVGAAIGFSLRSDELKKKPW